MLFWMAAVAGAFAVSFAIVFGGFSALFGVAAAVLALWAVLSPPRALVVFMVVDIFVRTGQHFIDSAIVSSADDATAVLLALSVVIAMVRGDRQARFIAPIGITALTVFAVWGVVSALANQVPASVWLPGGYLACKGALIAIGASQLTWSDAAARLALRVSAVLSTVVLFAAVINLALPDQWSTVFSVTGGANYRYGLPSLIGPFIHPFDMALISAIMAACAICYGLSVRWSVLVALVSASSVISLLLTFRRKELVGLAIALVVLLLLRRGWRTKVWAILVSPLAVIGLAPTVGAGASEIYTEYVVNGSDAARTVLTTDAFGLAAQYFPLGVGFGRFASRTAAVNYSPLYNELGYQSVWGLQDNIAGGQFLTDTSWPAIVGEAGAVGVVAFGAFLLCNLVVGFRMWNRMTIPLDAWVVRCAFLILIIVVADSIAAPVFTSPPGFGLLFLAVGVLTAYSRRNASGSRVLA